MITRVTNTHYGDCEVCPGQPPLMPVVSIINSTLFRSEKGPGSHNSFHVYMYHNTAITCKFLPNIPMSRGGGWLSFDATDNLSLWVK